MPLNISTQHANGTQAPSVMAPSFAGSGWTAVSTYTTSPRRAARAASRLGSPAKKVKGAWGSGQVGCVPAVCLLATEDGRVVLGAVDADELVAAVAH
jgi:hypothetical protein